MRLLPEMKAIQRYQLSPVMRQSVQLLSLPVMQCAEQIRNALHTNPFLSLSECESDDALPDVPVLASSSSVVKLHLEGRYFQENTTLTSAYTECEGLDDAASENFKADLAADLALLPLDEPLQVCLAFAVEAIDERGRLPEQLHDIMPQLLFFNRYQHQWETAVKLLQAQCEKGVGARNVRECLSLQLAELGHSRSVGLAKQLLASLWRDQSLPSDQRLALRLDCSQNELQQAKTLLRSLDRCPGRQYDQTPVQTMVSDVYIYQEDGCYCVAPNTELIPWLTVHPDLNEWKAQVRVVDPEVKRLMEQAEELVSAVRLRNLTLVRVAAELIARQTDFFHLGEQAISPLLLREVADTLGLHESTVSRAVNQKTMHTPKGVYEFKRFFSRSLSTVSGEPCSTTAVKAMLSDILAKENDKRPYSDVELVDRLGDEGIKIARRTVTKYRQQLNIPSFKERYHASRY